LKLNKTEQYLGHIKCMQCTDAAYCYRCYT